MDRATECLQFLISQICILILLSYAVSACKAQGYLNNNCYHNFVVVVVVQEDVLSILAKHLDESALQTRSFLVDVSGTSIDEEHISEQVQI